MTKGSLTGIHKRYFNQNDFQLFSFLFLYECVTWYVQQPKTCFAKYFNVWSELSQRARRAIFIETPCEFSSPHCLSQSQFWHNQNMDKCKTAKEEQEEKITLKEKMGKMDLVQCEGGGRLSRKRQDIKNGRFHLPLNKNNTFVGCQKQQLQTFNYFWGFIFSKFEKQLHELLSLSDYNL